MNPSVSYLNEIKSAIGAEKVESVSLSLPLKKESIDNGTEGVNLFTWEEFLELAKKDSFEKEKPPLFIWTKELIFFSNIYKGKTLMACVPRYPNNKYTPWHY